MAECDYQSLLSDGKCFAALSPFTLEVVKTQLLYQISGSAQTVDQLIAEAACYPDLPAFQVELLKTQILCDIAGGVVPDPPDPDPGEPPPIFNGGDPPAFECAGDATSIDSGYYFGLLLGEDPNAMLSQEQIDCMSAILDILVAEYLIAEGRTLISRQDYWQWDPSVFTHYSGLAKAAVNCDPNSSLGNVSVLYNGAYSLYAQICLEPL